MQCARRSRLRTSKWLHTVTATIMVLLCANIPATIAKDINENVRKSSVFIASYNYKGDLIGRGSGFFIDEGIILTNIHVIDGAARYYRIFTTSTDNALDPHCYKDINRSDIKLNLEDDVAYIRVFINCPHGSVFFADEDPKVGDAIGIFGYPALGSSFLSSFDLIHTQGVVMETIKGGIHGELNDLWFRTSAVIHAGNSGGPVVQDGKVVGIAVAATIGLDGQPIDGIFIPVSQIKRGLAHANNSTFGYTPQTAQKNPEYQREAPVSLDPFNPITPEGVAPSNIACRQSLGEGAEATGYTREQGDGCRCMPSYHRDPRGKFCLPGSPASMQEENTQRKNKTPLDTPIPRSPSTRPSSPPKIPQTPVKAPRIFESVCSRATKRFINDSHAWKRVQERMQKKFGSRCQ